MSTRVNVWWVLEGLQGSRTNQKHIAGLENGRGDSWNKKCGGIFKMNSTKTEQGNNNKKNCVLWSFPPTLNCVRPTISILYWKMQRKLNELT
jgi:hypothetical protein